MHARTHAPALVSRFLKKVTGQRLGRDERETLLHLEKKRWLVPISFIVAVAPVGEDNNSALYIYTLK